MERATYNDPLVLAGVHGGSNDSNGHTGGEHEHATDQQEDQAGYTAAATK